MQATLDLYLHVIYIEKSIAWSTTSSCSTRLLLIRSYSKSILHANTPFFGVVRTHRHRSTNSQTRRSPEPPASAQRDTRGEGADRSPASATLVVQTLSWWSSIGVSTGQLCWLPSRACLYPWGADTAYSSSSGNPLVSSLNNRFPGDTTLCSCCGTFKYE